MSGKNGNYSNIIIYDEERRYYYLNPQKNRPLTDDEIRGISIAQLDQTRRGIQGIYGEVAVPYKKYCVQDSNLTPTDTVFQITNPLNISNDFYIKCGNSIENPAVLYVKGYYIFLYSSNTYSGYNYLQYSQQQYPSSNIDINTQTDKTLTLSTIPGLTTPSGDRRDIVYIDLHFEEVTAASGPNQTIYYDSGLRDPRFGTETANRLRAVFDIRVYEGWTGAIDKTIFDNGFFLGAINTNTPTSQHYKVPIALIYRNNGNAIINSNQIVDLLTLYDKRPMSLEEVTYRTNHGGFSTGIDFLSQGITGFSQQSIDQSALIFEGAYATGANRGLDTKAFNTDSVTARVLDNNSKFLMNALQVGEETGCWKYPNTPATGPEQLNKGEIVANQESINKLYVGYDRSTTGVREYKDALSISSKGLTGPSSSYFVKEGVSGIAAFSIHNFGSLTGVYSAFISSYSPIDSSLKNFMTIDYKGSLGLNTFTPGWDTLPSYWDTSRYTGSDTPNIVLDVNDTARVRDHLFVDKDEYVGGDLFGKTWNIPGILNKQSKAFFGFTGIPRNVSFNEYGITGTQAVVVFKPGIATYGETGLSDYRGFTGQAGFYEAYNTNGLRVFTIGDLGENFDRVVNTLYGTSTLPLWYIKESLTLLPQWGRGLLGGDTVSYSIHLANGQLVQIVHTIPGGYTNSQAITDILNNIYTNINIANPEFNDPTWVYVINNVIDPSDPANGTIIIKDPTSHVDMTPIIDTVDYFIFTSSSLPDVGITGANLVDSHFYGSGSYGGDELNINFAKLDLGEAVDAWLFNGDVFFNGNGLLNRVTFSPNAIFRNDVFIYGTIFANNMQFVSASLADLEVSRVLSVLKPAYFSSQVAIGIDSLGGPGILGTETLLDPNLSLLVNGDVKASNFIANNTVAGSPKIIIGNSFVYSSVDVFANLGGSFTNNTNPFGLHIIDRSGVDVTTDPNTRFITVDFGDGRGNYGDVDVTIKGDLHASNETIDNSLTIGAGATGLVGTYDLFVSDNARVNGTLEVTTLKFIGSGVPGEIADIVEPQNIVTISNGNEVVTNKPNGILRSKDFSCDQKVIFQNSMAQPTYTPTNQDLEFYQSVIGLPAEIAPNEAFWLHDTLSYPHSAFVSTGKDTLSASDYNTRINTDPLFRLRFQRFVVATLGTIKMTWVGKINSTSPATPLSASSVIQSYVFSTPYFKDRSGNSVIDWSLSDIGRNSINNFMINVEANIIDDKSAAPYPQLYTINRPLWVFLPITSWGTLQFNISEVVGSETTNPRSVLLYHNYVDANDISINPLAYLNVAPLTPLNNYTGQTNAQWRTALHPRFISITRTALDLSDDLYQAQWDLDVVVYPLTAGTASSVIGKVYTTHI